MPQFKDFAGEKRRWITTLDSPFYPDYLDEAKVVFEPVLGRFGELLVPAADSIDLFRRILAEPRKVREQLLRVFRKYVLPGVCVEDTKRLSSSEAIIEHHGRGSDRLRRSGRSSPVVPLMTKPL